MILIIDGNNLAARNAHANAGLCRSDLTPTGAVYGSIRSLKSLIELFKPERVICVFDKGWSNWRLKLYPEYKADRKDINKTPEEIKEKERYIAQVNRLKEYIACLPMTLIQIKYTEADDIIAHILNKAIAEKKAEEFILVSNDKDFWQFIPFGVKIFDGMKGCFIDDFYIERELQIKSNQYIFYKSMLGDKGDNIFSVKGFGEKAAINVLNKKPCTCIADTKQNAMEITKKKDDKYQKFIDNFSIVERNYKLINLTDQLYLPEETKIEIDSSYNHKNLFSNNIYELIHKDEIKWDDIFLDVFKKL